MSNQKMIIKQGVIREEDKSRTPEKSEERSVKYDASDIKFSNTFSKS